MATNPVPADMQSLIEAIAALKAQATAIITQVQSFATNTGINATTITTASTFAMTPGQQKVDDIIDYCDKVVLSLWQADWSTPHQVWHDGTRNGNICQSMKAKAQEFGWPEGSRQITTFENNAGVNIDLIEQYGQITTEKLKIECDRFITGVEEKTRAHQNNEIMNECILVTLTTDAKLQLTPHQNDYTFNMQFYASLLHKMVMRLTIIDSRAMDLQLCDLRDLATYMISCTSDIGKFHQFFDASYSTLIARGKTGDDSISVNLLWVIMYLLSTWKTKKTNILITKHMKILMHEVLMAMAMAKCNYLVQKETWGQKSMEEEEIMALSAEVAGLKGKIKLAKNLTDIAENGNE